jgi:MoaA/NifB/PqqE/SkfB family radical SAM enzyme
MRHLLLPADSRFAAEARELDRSGAAVAVPIANGTTAEDLVFSPDDQVLVDARLIASCFFPLLARCRSGDLGDLRVLVDGDPSPLARIGLRARPWLRGVHVAENGRATDPSGILPAPISRVRGLREIVENWGPVPLRYAPVPCAFPPKLQIETTTACLARCAYCPKSALPDERSFMDAGLFDRIAAECGDGKPDSIELYFNGEPLLDARLEDLAGRIKRITPESVVSIITGEGALTLERARSLAGCGLDVVFVSVNVVGDPTESDVTRRIAAVASFRDVLGAKGTRLGIVSMGNFMAPATADALRRAAAREGLPLDLFRGTSRVGDVPIERFRRPDDRPPRRPCERPFTKAYIRYNGDVVLCCEDWRHTRVMGSLTTSTLAEIWTGNAYQDVRRALLARRVPPPCDRCDYVDGTTP